MREAQFLVFPAEWYEGFPLTIAEAFATGLPVVASRLGAMAELVEDGRTGLLFNPGDPVDLAAKVAWAADHPNELAEMGRRARQEFNAKYTAERNYQYLCHIYQQVIGACASAEQGGMASPAASSGVRSQSLTAGRRRSIACGPVP
jgi:glycosyltransferase involved in cell wall biosynthesis